MAWTWRYENREGQPVDGPAEVFPSQADAESWIGQTWRDLVAIGATKAILAEDGRTEYQMSLLPPGE